METNIAVKYPWGWEVRCTGMVSDIEIDEILCFSQEPTEEEIVTGVDLLTKKITGNLDRKDAEQRQGKDEQITEENTVVLLTQRIKELEDEINNLKKDKI
jgi:hypothetical protein